MDSQIWSKVEDKFAVILMLRGHEVHRLRVTGLLLKRKVQGILEALEQGQEPSAVGAKSVDTLDVRTIAKAEVSPGNSSLTLRGGPDGSTKLGFTPAESNADAILQAILAQSGRKYEPTQEEIGVVEALIPPVIVGVLAGLFWAGINQAAGQIARGEVIEVKAGRRQGMNRLLVSLAEMLGTNGTTVVGVLLLVLIVGWAASRIIRRPERTVWLPRDA